MFLIKNANSQFSWIDGWYFLYSNWPSNFDQSTQQNKCVFLENKDTLWSTGNCDAQNDFICKTTKGMRKF